MQKPKPTEPSVVTEIVSYLNEWLHQGVWSGFADVRALQSAGGKFPDMLIYLKNGDPFAVVEFKVPSKAPDTDYDNAREKTEKKVGCEYFITSNFNETIIWQAPDYKIKRFPPIGLGSLDQLRDEQKRIALFASWRSIMDFMVKLASQGISALTATEQSRFFIKLITDRVNDLRPGFRKAFETASKNSTFMKELRGWAVSQGIPAERDELLSLSSMQALYRLVIKVMFYFTLRRHKSDLPSLDSISAENLQESLRFAFAEALKVDFHAVFEEDIIDTVPLGQQAREKLVELIDQLSIFHFENAPLDVIGDIYENLIPHEDRYKLGQYFTPTPVVDLMITLSASNSNGACMLDPACGTGTFLHRAYEWFREKFGLRGHSEIIPRLWGVDIARFPAELATVNLYRKDPSRYENFPRIICKDFMELMPGQKVGFRHPLLEANVEEELPTFTTIVGNPPYVRQENIERVKGGYKRFLAETLERDGYNLEIKGNADMFISMFLHALKHLADRGRIGWVTANAYMSTEYGVDFKKVLLDNYSIRYVVASWAEPWFLQVDVNTAITIVENARPLDAEPVHFVSLKKSLSEIAPDDSFGSIKHWQRLTALKGMIDAAPYKAQTVLNWRNAKISIYEDDDLRVVSVPQKILRPEENWMVYLRAPDVFFELIEKAGEKFVRLGEIADLRFGLKCGIKEFFILSDEDVKIHKIEPELLKPVITSPAKITESLVAKPDAWLFVCDLDMDDLKRHYPNAWRYVKEGEKRETKERHQQKRGGVKFPKVPSVKHFKRWYTLPEPGIGDFGVPRSFNERIFVVNNEGKVILLDRFNYGTYNERGTLWFYNAYLVSSLAMLFIESRGRVELGAGALDFQKPDVREIPVPDPVNIPSDRKKEILSTLQKLKARAPLEVYQEVKQKDRQKLDHLILEALKLDPDEYLPRIYEGLVRMVAERTNLGKMRKTKAKQAREKDIQKLIDQVIETLVATGKIKPFPEAFIPPGTKTEMVALPGKTLEAEEFMKVYILRADGWELPGLSEGRALFILYAAKPRSYGVRVPTDDIIAQKAVDDFRKYVKELKEEIGAMLTQLLGDHVQAQILLPKVLEQIGLSEIS